MVQNCSTPGGNRRQCAQGGLRGHGANLRKVLPHAFDPQGGIGVEEDVLCKFVRQQAHQEVAKLPAEFYFEPLMGLIVV